MEQLPLGSSLLESSRIAYGCWRIATSGDTKTDLLTARNAVVAALDAGITFFDLADIYCNGRAESAFGQFMHEHPELRKKILIGTKCGLRPADEAAGAPYRYDSSADHIIRSCEGSLRRLGVERIDLWQLHRIDERTPRDEQFGVIADLQREGLIRHVGLSEVTVADVQEAQRHFDVVSVQNLYNVGHRASEELLAYSTDQGIGFIPWFPLGNRELLRPESPLARIADRVGAAPGQVALAWLLQHSPVMLPIPGTGSVAHLEENCAAAELVLDDATMAELDALAA